MHSIPGNLASGNSAWLSLFKHERTVVLTFKSRCKFTALIRSPGLVGGDKLQKAQDSNYHNNWLFLMCPIFKMAKKKKNESCDSTLSPLYKRKNTNPDFSMIKHSPMNWPLTIQCNTFHGSWGHSKDKAGRGLFLPWWGVQSTTPSPVNTTAQNEMFYFAASFEQYFPTDWQDCAFLKGTWKQHKAPPVGHFYTGP